MKKGGYQIIDFKNKPITEGVGMVIEGIYDLIEGTNKAQLLSGLFIKLKVAANYQHVSDFFAVPEVQGTEYVYFATVQGSRIRIAIQDTDVVTVVT